MSIKFYTKKTHGWWNCEKNNQDNPIEIKWKKKKHEDQFPINRMLNDEIETIHSKKGPKENQSVLTFEINDPSLKLKINPTTTKKILVNPG